jgi:hypothetical protein
MIPESIARFALHIEQQRREKIEGMLRYQKKAV